MPLGATITVAADGTVMANQPEQPNLPPTSVDKIKLADPSGSQVEKSLDGLFRVVGGGVLPTDDGAKLSTGTLEQSNVDPSQVLVQMLQAQRLFDIRTKLISTANEVDQSGTSLLRQSSS